MAWAGGLDPAAATVGPTTWIHDDEWVQVDLATDGAVVKSLPLSTSDAMLPVADTESAVPAADAAATSVHVGDLDGASATIHNKWVATVAVAVYDGEQNPVADATVSGAWSGGYSGAANCTTGSDGRCSLVTGNVSTKSDTVTFTIDAVTHATCVYEPADNADPDGDSDGTVITVFMP
jgi:hypothetical protein